MFILIIVSLIVLTFLLQQNKHKTLDTRLKIIDQMIGQTIHNSLHTMSPTLN